MRRAVSLSGAVFALLWVAMILFVLPAGAQDDGGIPPGTRATVSESGDDSSRPIVIVIAANGCTVSQDASITLEGDDDTQTTLSDTEDRITISAPNGQPRISGSGFGESLTDGNYSVVTSTGVSCERGNVAQGQYADDDGEVDEAEDVIIGTTSKKKIPNTGGPPLLLFGALLLGAAVIAGRVVLRP